MCKVSWHSIHRRVSKHSRSWPTPGPQLAKLRWPLFSLPPSFLCNVGTGGAGSSLACPHYRKKWGNLYMSGRRGDMPTTIYCFCVRNLQGLCCTSALFFSKGVGWHVFFFWILVDGLREFRPPPVAGHYPCCCLYIPAYIPARRERQPSCAE